MKICHQVHRWRNWGRSRGSKSVCSHSVTLIPFLTLTCISLEWKQFHWLSRVFSFYTSLSSSQQMHCSSTRALWLWITVCLCQVLHKTNWKSWTKTDFLVPEFAVEMRVRACVLDVVIVPGEHGSVTIWCETQRFDNLEVWVEFSFMLSVHVAF